MSTTRTSVCLQCGGTGWQYGNDYGPATHRCSLCGGAGYTSHEDSEPLTHAKLISVTDGSATPFLEAIDAVLIRTVTDGVLNAGQAAVLYHDLYNALVVEYEDTESEGADAPQGV